MYVIAIEMHQGPQCPCTKMCVCLFFSLQAAHVLPAFAALLPHIAPIYPSDVKVSLPRACQQQAMSTQTDADSHESQQLQTNLTQQLADAHAELNRQQGEHRAALAQLGRAQKQFADSEQTNTALIAEVSSRSPAPLFELIFSRNTLFII